MGLPQIGLEAALKIEKFLKNADRYNRAMDAMARRTAAASKSIQKSSKDAQRAGMDMMRSLRESPGGVDAHVAGARAASAMSASLGKVAAAAGIATAAIGGTVKAIDMLVEAGEQAAVVEDMRLSFQALAGSYDLSAKEMIANLRDLSRGTIETADLVKIANQSMMAGGREFAEALPSLYRISEAAAKTSASSTLEAMDGLVRGIAKGSSKLLGKAEIYELISDSVEKYARSINKTVDELDMHERQTATLLAVLENEEEMIARVGGATEAATDPFRKLTVQTKAYSDGIKTLLLPAATAVAEVLAKITDLSKKGFAAQAAMLHMWQNVPKMFWFSAEGIAAFNKKYEETLEVLRTGMNPIEDTGEAFEEVREVSEATQKRIEDLLKKLEELADKYRDKLAKILLQDARRREDMEKAQARRAEDDARATARREEDRERANARKREDMDIANARKREDIARENAKRLADARREQNRKQLDFDREAQLAREKLEREHQDNLAKIERETLDDIRESARKNDAVAIARSLRQRQIDIREEKISNNIKKRELEISLAEKQRKLDEDAKEENRRLQEQADDRLAQQILAEQRQEEDFQLHLARQLEDEKLFLDRQAEMRKLALERQEEDRNISMQRQLDDLNSWYDKEKALLEKQLEEQRRIANEQLGLLSGELAEETTNFMKRIAGTSLGVIGGGRVPGRLLTPDEAPEIPVRDYSEAWPRRHEFLRAEGGVDVVDRPTRFVAGEAGPELAAFIPLRNNRLDIGGGLDVNVNGAGTGGMNTAAMQAMIFEAMVTVARRISVAR